MVDLKRRPDGRWEEVTPPACPNGHPWDRLGTCSPLWDGARGWQCLTEGCGAEVWDESPRSFGRYPVPSRLGQP